MHFRFLVIFALALFATEGAAAQNISGNVFERLKAGGLVILMRHAQTTPGVGDPPGFRPDDCATQRNLNDAGRAQARLLGQRLRQAGVVIARAASSAWCRCVDTARLISPGVEIDISEPLGSYWRRGDDSIKTASAQARSQIAAWRGPGNLLMVTHQVNVAAIMGPNLQMGGFVVIEPRSLTVLATVNP
ncbi:MAG: histidine phosphatase family protein [Hyphomicrobiales bacterium]|nr:histidine phosphatase family protein [Hyphomicrobiales bacterium]